MKRLTTTFLFTLLLTSVAVAQQVQFRFTDGINDDALKSKMETRVTRLLTEINRAAAADRPLQLQNVQMTSDAKASLSKLWTAFHFRCEYTENAQSCLTDASGYEVRGITVTILNKQMKGERLREICINLSKDGTITSVHMALNNNMYLDIISNHRNKIDKDRRLEILNFVEKFRSMYDEKDINALRDIFSDDALIITGRIITHKSTTNDMVTMKSKVVYRKQNKEEYLQNLKKTFDRNRYIHLTFDDIKIYGHKSKPNFYGVSLRQDWRSSTYTDNGYVFLLWEFPDNKEEDPVIHVRTWQPQMVGGKPMDKDSVFNINDFFIP